MKWKDNLINDLLPYLPIAYEIYQTCHILLFLELIFLLLLGDVWEKRILISEHLHFAI